MTQVVRHLSEHALAQPRIVIVIHIGPVDIHAAGRCPVLDVEARSRQDIGIEYRNHRRGVPREGHRIAGRASILQGRGRIVVVDGCADDERAVARLVADDLCGGLVNRRVV